MEQALPVTIGKHWAGYVAIAVVGIGVLGLLLLGLYESVQSPWANAMVMFAVCVFAVGLVVAATIVTLYVYSLSYMTFTNNGINQITWLSLFAKQDIEAEWVRVQDVSVVKAGIFAQLLNFGTLNIQTAGDYQNVRMTMVPNPEYWQDVARYYADLATNDGPYPDAVEATTSSTDVNA